MCVLWKANIKATWRNNGSGVALWGGIVMMLVGCAWLVGVPRTSNPLGVFGFIPIFVGFVVCIIGVIVFFVVKGGVWTLTKSTLSFHCRRRHLEWNLSRIRAVDVIVPTNGGGGSIVIYLQSGMGGTSEGWFTIPLSYMSDVERGIDAFRKLGVKEYQMSTDIGNVFPSWMSERARKILSNNLGRGERLLWVGHSEKQSGWRSWGLAMLVAWMILEVVSDISPMVARCIEYIQHEYCGMDGKSVGLLSIFVVELTVSCIAIWCFIKMRSEHVAWITSLRMGGLAGHNKESEILTVQCLTKFPVVHEDSKGRVSIFVTMVNTDKQLADITSVREGRKWAVGFLNLSKTEAEGALSVLKDILQVGS